MAEIKQQSNLDWFATLPEMQQEFLHESYPTDELKQGWFDLGKPYVYEGPYDYPMEIDPMTGIGPGNIRKMVNFEINPNLGVLGKIRMERNVPLKEYKQDPNPGSYTSLVEIPYYMKTLPFYFFPPAAPFAAGFDIVEGIYDRNPLQVGLSALGVGGISRMVQAALAGGALYMPKDADAKIISKALEYIKGIATKAKGQPIKSTANELLTSLEKTVANSGQVKGVEFRAIRDHLNELKYASDKVQPLTKIVDDINSFNYFDDIVTDSIISPINNQTMFVTRMKPKHYNELTPEGKVYGTNKRNIKISKSTNKDAEVHYPTNDNQGIMSHTIYKIDPENPNILRISEFQSDMASHTRHTGFGGTPENKIFMDKTKDLFHATSKKYPFDSVNPSNSLVNDLRTQTYSREMYEASISHPSFPKKVFDDWKNAEPELWAKMQDDIANKSEIDMSAFFDRSGNMDGIANRTRGNAQNPFKSLVEMIHTVQPIKGLKGSVYGTDPFPSLIMREAPPSHPLLMNDNWLHYEIANVLEQATLNPNIKQIVLPNAEEAIARYQGAMTPGTEKYLRRIYDKEVPRIIKNLGVKFTQKGTPGKYGDIIGENQYAALIGAVDDVNARGKLLEIFSDEGLDMSEGVVRWVQQNVLGIGAANAKNTNTASLLLEALESGQLGKGYLDTLETIAQEVIRVSPGKEKAINKYIEILYSADTAATAAAKFKLEPFSNAVENMAKGMQGDEPGRVIRAMEDSVAGYSDNFAFKFEEILNNNLTKQQIKELENAGLIARMSEPNTLIEVTPELIDKIQNVGVPGI